MTALQSWKLMTAGHGEIRTTEANARWWACAMAGGVWLSGLIALLLT